MDGTESRRRKSEANRRRKSLKNYGNMFWKKLITHKRTLFTGMLLFLLVVLLFGVANQLKSPTEDTTPYGMTAIDYSTFVAQVRVGNVMAVNIQGNNVEALLRNSLSQEQGTSVKSATAASQASQASHAKGSSASMDYAAWVHQVSINASSWTGPAAASISPDRSIYTRMPAGGDPQLMPLLLNEGVTINAQSAGAGANWLGVIWKFAPFLLMVILLLVLLSSRNSSRSMRSVDDRVNQMMKSRARRFERVSESKSEKPASVGGQSTKPTASSTPRISLEPPVTFNDVAGIDEVRAELEEIVQFLRSPEQFNRMGARIPRGALLVGPPGTGKTLLAKAVAGEASVPFFSISASEFVEMFVGVGASRVRDLFNQARQASPCVVFIDEIDAVGRKRSMRVTGNDERDQTLNQLLVELDGFDARHAVVVLAATNRVDILDKALLRPGRFDRRITVSLPDRVGREAILKVHTRRTPLHEEVSLERLSRLTTGMSGADLANLVNEAALSAARQGLDSITHDCFEDALVRVQLGALRPLVMGEKDRQVIAFHEGGHALVAYHLPEADTVNRVTILPRGQSLGVTQFTAEEDRYNYSRQTLMARIAVGLGGRVAEELAFGPDHITTGAENDLQVVTDLARRMVTRWGMSEQVGVVFTDYRPEDGYALNMRRLDPDAVQACPSSLVMDADGNLLMHGGSQAPQQLFSTAYTPRTECGAALNAVIDAEVQHILNEGRETARRLLQAHYDQLTLLATTLMEREQLDRAQFEALLKQ